LQKEAIKNVVKSLIMLEIQTSKTKEPSTKEVAYIYWQILFLLPN
jgi:hypothetical protein